MAGRRFLSLAQHTYIQTYTQAHTHTHTVKIQNVEEPLVMLLDFIKKPHGGSKVGGSRTFQLPIQVVRSHISITQQ